MSGEQHHHYCALIVSSDALEAFSLVPLLLYDDSMRESEAFHTCDIIYTHEDQNKKEKFFSKIMKSTSMLYLVTPLLKNHSF